MFPSLDSSSVLRVIGEIQLRTASTFHGGLGSDTNTYRLQVSNAVFLSPDPHIRYVRTVSKRQQSADDGLARFNSSSTVSRISEGERPISRLQASNISASTFHYAFIL